MKSVFFKFKYSNLKIKYLYRNKNILLEFILHIKVKKIFGEINIDKQLININIVFIGSISIQVSLYEQNNNSN